MKSILRSIREGVSLRVTRTLARYMLPVICGIAIVGCGSSRETESTGTPPAEPSAMAPAATEQAPEASTEAQFPAATPPNDESGAQVSASSADNEANSMDQGDYSDTVWAPGKEQKLMLGLDGGLYEPYRASVVRETQRELKREGFYDGPISGVVDEQTMKALGEFQRDNGLQASGVPTPLTREELFEEPTSSGVS